jgi:predicted phage tail protein
MLREIRLYGQLAKFIGHRVLHADVSSAAEAVRFLLANWPALEQHMASQHYRVALGERDLALEEVCDPAGSQTIKIVPVIGGAGGGTGQILAGIGLIAASIILAPAGAGFLGLGAGLKASVASGLATGFISAGASSIIGSIGVVLVLGGISQLMTPTTNTPQGVNQQDDPRKSYSFSGVQNVSRAGVPVPIIFGEVVVGSTVISAAIDIDQI